MSNAGVVDPSEIVTSDSDATAAAVPATPSRVVRRRRTRSITRSPSPVKQQPADGCAPQLEPLHEELDDETAPPPRKKPATPVRAQLSQRRRSTRSQTRSPSPTLAERIVEPAALDTLAEVEENAAEAVSNETTAAESDVVVPEVAADAAAVVDDEDIADDLDDLPTAVSSQIEAADLEENLDDDDDAAAAESTPDQDAEMTELGDEASTEANADSAAAENTEEAAVADRADSESANVDAASTAEQPAAASERPARRALSPVNVDTFFSSAEDEPELRTDGVRLSWIDSDIYLKLDAPDCLAVTPINHNHLALAYGGVRGTHGVRSGRVCYEVHNTGVQKTNGGINGGGGNGGNDEQQPLDLRVGWSAGDTDLQLGESPLSFAYSSAGKKATDNVFEKYGVHLLRNDVVGVYLDLESEPCRIEYTVNGVPMGVAFEFQLAELGGRALFPHVSSKSVKFRCNFGELDGEQMLVNTVLPEFDQPDDRSYRHRTRRTTAKVGRSRKNGRNAKGAPAATTTESESETVASAAAAAGDDAKDAAVIETVESDVVKSEAEVAVATDDGAEQVTEAKVSVKTEDTDADAHTSIAEPIETEDCASADLKTEADDDASPSAEAASKSENAEQDNASEPAVDEAESIAAAAIESTDTAVAESAPASVSEGAKDGDTATPAAAAEVVVPVAVVHTLLDGYVFIGLVAVDQLVAGPQRPETRAECEVIVLVGLPGAGKSYWVNERLGLKQPALKVAKPSDEPTNSTGDENSEKDAEKPEEEEECVQSSDVEKPTIEVTTAASGDDANASEDAAVEPVVDESMANDDEAKKPTADESIADAETVGEDATIVEPGVDAPIVEPASESLPTNYYVIGAAMLLDRMRIGGEPRQQHMYSRRYEYILRNLTDTCSQLVAIAAKRRRNYIIDQPHVTQYAQRTAIRQFGEFRRTAVVVMPAESEYRERRQQQQEQQQLSGCVRLYTQNQENTMKGECRVITCLEMCNEMRYLYPCSQIGAAHHSGRLRRCALCRPAGCGRGPAAGRQTVCGGSRGRADGRRRQWQRAGQQQWGRRRRPSATVQ